MFKKKSLLAAGMALILAACGQGGESSEESSSNPDAKEVTVAVENSSKPLSFTDDSGELTGYEVETIKALDEVVDDYNFNIESVDAEGTQVGLDTGKYQMMGGGLYKTKEREDLYLFPDENSGASIIRIYKRKDDDSIKTLDDLTDKKVHPVTPNGGIFNLLTEYNEDHPDKKIDIQLGKSGDFAQQFQAIDERKSDAVVIPSNIGANDIIDELDLNVEPVEEPVRVNPTYFVLAPDQEDLKTAVDEGIKELKENGRLKELSEKWYGEDMFQYEITES